MCQVPHFTKASCHYVGHFIFHLCSDDMSSEHTQTHTLQFITCTQLLNLNCLNESLVELKSSLLRSYYVDISVPLLNSKSQMKSRIKYRLESKMESKKGLFWTFEAYVYHTTPIK